MTLQAHEIKIAQKLLLIYGRYYAALLREISDARKAKETVAPYAAFQRSVEALRAKRRDPTNPIGKLARDGLVE
jgi:hypothetical protein